MIGLSLHSAIFYSYFDTFHCYCVWCVRTSVWFDVMILIFCSNVFFNFVFKSLSLSHSFSLFLLSFSSFPIESSFMNIVLWIFIVWLCVFVLGSEWYSAFHFRYSFEWIGFIFADLLILKPNQWMNEIFENFDWIIFYTSIWVFEHWWRLLQPFMKSSRMDF